MEPPTEIAQSPSPPPPPPPPSSPIPEPQDPPVPVPPWWSTLETGDVLRVILPNEAELHSYALYCGRGRVIHSWSYTRHRFRVRVDHIRVLGKVGCRFEWFTDLMDEYCDSMMALEPLDSDMVVQRARQAIHAVTSCRGSSLSLVLWARYGDVVFSMAESLVKELPCLSIRLSQVPDDDTRLVLEQERLHALVSRLSIHPSHDATPLPIPHVIPRPPPTPEIATNDEQEQRDIVEFMGSVVERIVSEWIRATLTDDYDEFPAPEHSLHAILVPDVGQLRAAELPGLLVFDAVSQGFKVIFKANGSIAERLAADNMECGICLVDLSDTVVSLLQCSHYLCRTCLWRLSQNQCPYCRASIVFYREIDHNVKQAALEIMQQANEALSVVEPNEQSLPDPS